MKVIPLSKTKLKAMELLKLPKEVLNTEGNLYCFDYYGKKTVLKYLFDLDGERFASKLYTIEMLNKYKDDLPKSFTIPESLCTLKGDVVGFTSPFVEGKNLASILQDPKLNHTEAIKHLKKIGNLLNDLKNIRTYGSLSDIYLNDLHESNFIVNKNGELFVVDLDSCKIANNSSFPARYLTPMSLLNYTQGKYVINTSTKELGYVKANENSDLYCYNMVILNYLFKGCINRMSIYNFYDYLNYLDLLKINPKLLDCFSRIINNCDNEDPTPYLETLTEKQVALASRKIYREFKK